MVLKGADLDGGGVGQRTPEVFARARPHLQPVRIMDGPAKIVEAPPPCRTEEEHRSEEHTSELQSLMRISYAVFCLKKKKKKHKQDTTTLNKLDTTKITNAKPQ